MAEREVEVRCETAGAQPPAVISWWINGEVRLKSFKNEVSVAVVRTMARSGERI